MFEINSNQSDDDDSDAEEYADYKEHEPPMQQAPSTLYQMIWQAVHEDRESPVKFPEGCGRRVIYILGCPLTHSQWLTVKNPMKPKQENYYPVSLFMASLWILFYSFIIVWFTFEVTQAWKLRVDCLSSLKVIGCDNRLHGKHGAVLLTTNLNCSVSLVCTATSMTVTLNTEEPFGGRLFAQKSTSPR